MGIFSDKLTTLDDLFHEQLKDLYSAENQLLKVLPDMADKAKDAGLKKAFQSHLEETKNQVARLEKIGKLLDISLTGHECQAMKGLLKEGTDMIHEDATDEVKDAGLIASAQRVEHYEISGYGTAAHYAQRVGQAEAAKLLHESLSEEQAADTKLNNLAKGYINQKAL
ncbi:Ferritin-like metal-binding protein YciE [Hymenobacter daecheongensis DSM 21074]|uniref:Ferritin-like metal-binding protein YciE n=1 Tax=Hymenobacter daecheongensis DSM 21074 TaxID=1121955 RepID=A0A1M6G6E1_9BACT|nr:ferritin-like domain-containing protein [Hymenobacter daecheongensis]SHJ05531.1 Ferritin-like metal-binding protein YciE [Hymenobacter daecheongensis DSM 21074]